MTRVLGGVEWQPVAVLLRSLGPVLAFWMAGAAAAGLPAAQVDLQPGSLEPQGYVSDFASVFTPVERRQLESLLQELDRKAGAQLAVVTLPSLEGNEIRDFANRLFEKWGVGHAKDDRGLLVLMAVEDRTIWVEVGYGLEPLLPDGKVGRLLDQYVVPRFKAGDYAGGLTAGALAFAREIARDAGVELTGELQTRPPPDSSQRGLGCVDTLVAIFVLILFLYLVIRHPWLLFFLLASGRGGGGGGFGGGGFGGFGGGASGGGGAGRSW